MCQGDFSHNIWGLGGGSFQRGAGEFGDSGGEGHFQPLGEASQAVLRLLRIHRFLPSIFLIFPILSRRHRDCRAQDKGDRCPWRVGIMILD